MNKASPSRCLLSSSEPRKNPKAPTPSYIPTRAERKALAAFCQRLEQQAPSAAAKIAGDGTALQGTWDHPDQAVAALLWASALGTGDLKFAATVFAELVQISAPRGTITEADLNGTLSLVRGMAPTDPTESLLIVQMAAIHKATLRAAAQLASAVMPAQQESACAMLNKLARTFSMQIDALKRYRLKGEQTIKVQHVTVNEGGRAIVGDVQHTAGAVLKNEEQSHELSAPHALGAALLGPVQTNGQRVPSSGCEGTTGVPLPRRARRSAKRCR